MAIPIYKFGFDKLKNVILAPIIYMKNLNHSFILAQFYKKIKFFDYNEFKNNEILYVTSGILSK